MIPFSCQKERGEHMAIKRLLKKLLKVNCVKIIGLEITEKNQELLVYLESTQGQKSRALFVARNVPVTTKPPSKRNGEDLTSEPIKLT